MTFARIRAIAIVSVLVVAALVFVAAAILRDNQTGPFAPAGCPKDAIIADTRLPEPSEVKINVYNATDHPGLANQVKIDFANRKFTVLNTGNDPKGKRVDQVAVLRYGPKAVGAAWLLRAYFLDQAAREFDITRKDAVVDVVIGTQFKQLATVTEFHQALAQLGNPTLPEGTCNKNAR
jgi:LytR cell envelope-related transcriptional attenuator